MDDESEESSEGTVEDRTSMTTHGGSVCPMFVGCVQLFLFILLCKIVVYHMKTEWYNTHKPTFT